MRIFNLDERFSVVCSSESTRNGFRHVAVLHSNGFEVYRTRICYFNRTWERHEFESILEELIGERFKGEEKEKFLKVIKTFS